MNALRRWQIVLLLVAIFAVGAVSGALVTLRVVKRAAAKAGQPQNMLQAAARYYQRQLELTPEQVEQLRPVFQQTAREIAASRRDMFHSMQRMHEEMEKVLTPEQQTKFAELRERARARIKNQLESAPRQQLPAKVAR